MLRLFVLQLAVLPLAALPLVALPLAALPLAVLPLAVLPPTVLRLFVLRLFALRLAALRLAALRHRQQLYPGLPVGSGLEVEQQVSAQRVFREHEVRAPCSFREDLQRAMPSGEPEPCVFSERVNLLIPVPARQTSRFLAPGHLLSQRRILVIVVLLDGID